jgi:hypothetical protein
MIITKEMYDEFVESAENHSILWTDTLALIGVTVGDVPDVDVIGELEAEIVRLRVALSACVWDLTELYGEVLADSKQQGIDRVERDVVLIAARAALAQETQP